VDQVDQARAAVAGAKENLSLVKEGARKEAIDQARARRKQAVEGLALARTRLSYAAVVSPLKRDRSLQECRAGGVRRRGDRRS